MEDFAKRLIVLVLLVAFFGAFFLELPIIFKKIQRGKIPFLNFLNFSNSQRLQNNNHRINNYSSKDKRDNSTSSRICVPAIDGDNC